MTNKDLEIKLSQIEIFEDNLTNKLPKKKKNIKNSISIVPPDFKYEAGNSFKIVNETGDAVYFEKVICEEFRKEV